MIPVENPTILNIQSLVTSNLVNLEALPVELFMPWQLL